MSDQFVKATKQQRKARIAIDGPTGSGKTYTALVAAQAFIDAESGRIAVIDTEHGSASLYSELFDFDVLQLDNFAPDNYIKALSTAEIAKYTVVVIDSLSHAWEGEGGVLDINDKIARQKGGNSFAAWKDTTPIQRGFIETILSSSCHIIVTMRSKMDYTMDEISDQKGYKKTVVSKVGMNPIQRQGVEYEFDLVGDLDVGHTMTITKSRFHFMADVSKNKPDKDFFKQLVDWLNSGENIPVVPRKIAPVKSNGKSQQLPPPPAEWVSQLVEAKLTRGVQETVDILNMLNLDTATAIELVFRTVRNYLGIVAKTGNPVKAALTARTSLTKYLASGGAIGVSQPQPASADDTVNDHGVPPALPALPGEEV